MSMSLCVVKKVVSSAHDTKFRFSDTLPMSLINNKDLRVDSSGTPHSTSLKED